MEFADLPIEGFEMEFVVTLYAQYTFIWELSGKDA